MQPSLAQPAQPAIDDTTPVPEAASAPAAPSVEPEDHGPTLFDRILSPLRLAFGFTLTAASSAATIPLALLLLPSRPARIKLCNYYGKLLGRALISVAGIRPTVRNRDRIERAFPAIYVSNHTSVADMFFAVWLCPVGGCGVAKKEIGNIPFFGWLYRLSGHLLIDRGNRESAIAALTATADIVKKHNLSIWMWPEGTRSKDGRLLPIKKGLGHLAIATGLPIVPVVIHNAHKNWPKNEFTLRPTDVEVDILEPIRTDHWRAETLDENLAEVHRAFAEALNPGQKPAPGKAVVLPFPRGARRGPSGVRARGQRRPLALLGRSGGRGGPSGVRARGERPPLAHPGRSGGRGGLSAAPFWPPDTPLAPAGRALMASTASARAPTIRRAIPSLARPSVGSRAPFRGSSGEESRDGAAGQAVPVLVGDAASWLQPEAAVAPSRGRGAIVSLGERPRP